MEVAMEKQLEVHELMNLKDQVHQLACNKLYKTRKLSEAWKILDDLYGQASKIRSKLNGQLLFIKLKLTKSQEKEIELFDTVQYTSAWIKVIGGENMLKADSEYISIVLLHLDKDQVRLWVQTRAQDWNSFFNFLEQIAKDPRQMQVWENSILEVAQSSVEEKVV